MSKPQAPAARFPRTVLWAACFAWLLALGPLPAGAGEPEGTLRGALLTAGPLAIDGHALPKERLRRLYARRNNRPIWVVADALTAQGWAALSVLGRSFEEGLDPAKYLFVPIQARVAAHDLADSASGQHELELLISAGLLGYLADVSAGRLAPRESDPELFAYPNPADPVAALAVALRAPDLAAELRRMAPTHGDYRRLRAALARYRDLADRGGWLRVPEGPKLELGDRDPRVFQARHGLDVDGIVGPKTLAALNVSIEARIRQIQANMERWRWLPRHLEARYALINAAGFELQVVEDGIPRTAMAVVVGRPHRRTPIFRGEIGHMILNPDWTVPRSIARRDLLPKIRRDPDYLAQRGFQVWSDWSQGARLLDPAQIDWQAIDGERFPYKLRQSPGPGNALGRIKFMLPNRHSVYLHDTPNKGLFRKTARPFSSGCVRLSRPIDFAEYLMAGASDWGRARIEAEIATGETLPVYFTYFTAWVEEAGEVQFRDDIYERDKALLAALIDQLIIQSSWPAGKR
jgi:murein L,D-transpeptidase YcbB/YkuD